MKIIQAEIIMHNGKRILGFEVPFSQASNWLENNADKLPAEYEIKRRRLKRSNNANAYMWVLADKIAAMVGITKEEVYRAHVKEVGVFNDLMINENAANSFVKAWEHNGVGWFAEISNGTQNNNKIVRVYYGSSIYDTKQMARLIDNIIEEAKSLGIETMTPDEIEHLKSTWQPVKL